MNHTRTDRKTLTRRRKYIQFPFVITLSIIRKEYPLSRTHLRHLVTQQKKHGGGDLFFNKFTIEQFITSFVKNK